MELKIFMTTSLTLALVVTINCLYVCCLTCQIKSGLIRLSESGAISKIPQKEKNVCEEKDVVEEKNEEEKEKCAAEENARKNVIVVDEMRKKTLRERRNVNLKLDLSEISANKPKRCAKVLRDLNLKSEADFDEGLQRCTKGIKDLNIKSGGDLNIKSEVDLNIKSEDDGDRGLEMTPFRPRAYQF